MVTGQRNGDHKRRLGRRGEDIAAGHLQRRGYVIVARNWRCPTGEIDIVAQEGETLAFVEVRARQGERFGTPEESITPDKQAKLVTLAETYLQEEDLADVAWRIDVVGIVLGRHGEVRRVNLIRNAVHT
jgi:putative endonuclease